MNLNIYKDECDCSEIYNYPLVCFHQYYERLMNKHIDNDNSLNSYDLNTINKLWNGWNIQDKKYYLEKKFSIEKLEPINDKSDEENADILKKFINNLIELIYHNKRLYFFNNIFNSQIISLKGLYKFNYILIIIAIIIYIILYINICFLKFDDLIYLIMFYVIIFLTFLILIIILKLIFSNKFIFENKSKLSDYLSILTSKDILLYYTFNIDIIIQILILFTILICLKIFPYKFLPFSVIILTFFLNFILFFIYYAVIIKENISKIKFIEFSIILLFILVLVYYCIDLFYEKVIYNNVFKKQDECETDSSNCTIFQNNNANKILFVIKSVIGIISIIIIIYRLFYKLNNIQNYNIIDNIKQQFVGELNKNASKLKHYINNNITDVEVFKTFINNIIQINELNNIQDYNTIDKIKEQFANKSKKKTSNLKDQLNNIKEQFTNKLNKNASDLKDQINDTKDVESSKIPIDNIIQSNKTDETTAKLDNTIEKLDAKANGSRRSHLEDDYIGEKVRPPRQPRRVTQDKTREKVDATANGSRRSHRVDDDSGDKARPPRQVKKKGRTSPSVDGSPVGGPGAVAPGVAPIKI